MTSPYAPSINPDGSTNVPNDGGTTTRVPLGGGGGGNSNNVNNATGNGPDVNPLDGPLGGVQDMDLGNLIRRALLASGMNAGWFSDPVMKRTLQRLQDIVAVQGILGGGGSSNNIDRVNNLSQYATKDSNYWWDQVRQAQLAPESRQTFREAPETASLFARLVSGGNLGRQLTLEPYINNVMMPTYESFSGEERARADRTTFDLMRQLMGGDYNFDLTP